MITTDVVIAGAGPNGLMLAGELCLAGVRPIVLERRLERTGENRANGLVGQVVRLMDHRGLYEALGGGPEPPRPAPSYMFGALPLNLGTLPGNSLYVLPVPQRRVEQVLEERATALGAEIRNGHELTGLTQDPEGVTLDVAGPDGPYRLRARYLVGADGGGSRTRKLCGIGFPGVTRDDTISLSAHVTLPADLLEGPGDGPGEGPANGPVNGVVNGVARALHVPGYGTVPAFTHHRTDHGIFVFAPFPHGTGVTTIESGRQAPQGPPTLEELRDSVRRVLGADLPFGPPETPGPHLLRRLTGGNTRQAERYQDGRVLLLGDAAHVHSAMGGPGLNLGLQDAVNLGWKLAAEVTGQAPPGLLDTYQAERRPVGRRVIMHTQAQAVLSGPGADVTALRELFAELLTDPANLRRVTDLLSGADNRYPEGDAPAHPLTGRLAPELRLDTGQGPVRLAELTRNARPLLLDLTGADRLGEEAALARGRVGLVTARLVDGPALADGPAPAALLLRPDCHVAWATGDPLIGAADRAALRAALTRWFGPAPAR